MTGKTRDGGENFASALLPVLMFILASLSPIIMHGSTPAQLDESNAASHTGSTEAWNGYEQPWGQFGRTPTHNGSMPLHGPNGGPGAGPVSDITHLGNHH